MDVSWVAVRDGLVMVKPTAAIAVMATRKVTMFDLPVRGTESRHISMLERDGKLSVVIPVPRSSQMGVLTVRTEAELAALKAQAK